MPRKFASVPKGITAGFPYRISSLNGVRVRF